MKKIQKMITYLGEDKWHGGRRRFRGRSVQRKMKIMVTSYIIGSNTVYSDLLLFTSTLFDRRHVEDAVSIDIEGHVDLRDTAGHRRDAFKLKFAEEKVIFSYSMLAFEHLDQHAWLVINVGREGLALHSRDITVTLNKGGHDATSGLDTEGQRGHIEQKDILNTVRLILSGQDSGLYSSTVGDGLIRVNGLVQLLAVEKLHEKLLYLRDTSRAAYEDDFMYL